MKMSHIRFPRALLTSPLPLIISGINCGELGLHAAIGCEIYSLHFPEESGESGEGGESGESGASGEEKANMAKNKSETKEMEIMSPKWKMENGKLLKPFEGASALPSLSFILPRGPRPLLSRPRSTHTPAHTLCAFGGISSDFCFFFGFLVKSTIKFI